MLVEKSLNIYSSSGFQKKKKILCGFCLRFYFIGEKNGRNNRDEVVSICLFGKNFMYICVYTREHTHLYKCI